MLNKIILRGTIGEFERPMLPSSSLSSLTEKCSILLPVEVANRLADVGAAVALTTSVSNFLPKLMSNNQSVDV